MSANSPVFYSQQYTTAVELSAQQMPTKIAQFFSPMTAEGKSATVVNLIDAFDVDERITRLDDITFADPAQRRPWVFPKTYDKAVAFDNLDAVRMNVDPRGEYVMGLRAAINRKEDDESIRAFFGDRIVSSVTSDSVTDSFAAGQQISVNVGGTASGLNVEKIQAGLELFAVNEIDTDNEEIFIAISPKQERNLANEIEVVSSDFFGGYMRTRSFDGFLKMRYIITNRLGTDASGYRRVPMWTRRGMTFATWMAPRIDVSQRKDKRGLPWQAYIDGTFGAVRRDEKRVVEIKCAES